MHRRILIVDDEQDISEILQYNLQMEGYTTMTASSGEEALSLLGTDNFDLILLDVMMDGISGFEVARRVKADATTAAIPIIFCTARTEEKDVVDGFTLGSDDYITKPFRLSEVKARVRAVLRRTASLQKAETKEENSNEDENGNLICFEGLKLDTTAKTCMVDGTEVTLTKLEFELLALLLEHPHTVFSREEILSRIWPSDTYVLDRTVDVNITRLRKKIGQYGKCIRTRFGYGYSFEK